MSSGMNLFDSLRKGLDRASFEADRMLRANRVRVEAARLQSQAQERTRALGERVLALYSAGTLREPDLLDLARDIADLQTRARQKEEEAAAVQAEVWVEPPDALPPAPGAGSVLPAAGPSAPPLNPSPAPQMTTAPPPAPAAPAAPRQLDDQGTRRVPVPAAHEYCLNCGAPLRRNAAFCAQCGTRV